jgi:hypothetical protein
MSTSSSGLKSKSRKKLPLLHDGLLLGLLLNPEEGALFSFKRRLSFPEDRNLHNLRCEILKSYERNLILNKAFQSKAFTSHNPSQTSAPI